MSVIPKRKMTEKNLAALGGGIRDWGLGARDSGFGIRGSGQAVGCELSALKGWKIPACGNGGGSLWCGSRSGLLNPQLAIGNHQGGLTLRDVKNEGTTGDVYENKGDGDTMSSQKQGFYTKMHPLRDNRQESS
jgi:hypothetical protein